MDPRNCRGGIRTSPFGRGEVSCAILGIRDARSCAGRLGKGLYWSLRPKQDTTEPYRIDPPLGDRQTTEMNPGAHCAVVEFLSGPSIESVEDGWLGVLRLASLGSCPLIYVLASRQNKRDPVGQSDGVRDLQVAWLPGWSEGWHSRLRLGGDFERQYTAIRSGTVGEREGWRLLRDRAVQRDVEPSPAFVVTPCREPSRDAKGCGILGIVAKLDAFQQRSLAVPSA